MLGSLGPTLVRNARAVLLGAIVALCALVSPLPADPDSPAPTPTPELLYGTTPVDGCPRFFIGLPLAQIDGCADRLAVARWGLSAVDYVGDDRFSGAFEPDSPKRWLVSDDDGAIAAETEKGFAVDVVDTGDHIVIEYQRGTGRSCNDLLLYAIDFHVPDKRRYFIKSMPPNAALGCVPASYYHVLRKESIQQENANEYIAYVPGDPHETAAYWAGSDADQAAFERRAAARGFFRLALRNPPDRWGKTAGPRYAETIAFDSAPSRFAKLEKRLQAAVDSGERVVGIVVDEDHITILWERREQK